MVIMVGKKALANRAFLIDAWNNSINSTKRPPKNKQELGSPKKPVGLDSLSGGTKYILG